MILTNTKCYLAGPMQYASDGTSWRKDMKAFLEGIDVKVFDPYKNIFVDDKQETNDEDGLFRKLLEAEEYDKLSNLAKTNKDDGPAGCRYC
jgi:nucleoside 2-deoxyribosyltransferase